MYNYEVYHTGKKIPSPEIDYKNIDIKLRDNQKKNFDRLLFILNKYGFAFDSSVMGLGKSITSSILGFFQNKKICVLCPKDCEMVWNDLDEKFPEFNIKCIFTREEISGSSRSVPNGTELVKGKTCQKGKKTIIKYTPGKLLLRLIKRNYFFIVDEAHMCKNDSNINRAISCISSEIIKNYNNENDSMILLTTGTLSEKELFFPLYNLMGLLENGKLFSGRKDVDKEYSGMKSVVEFCKEIDKEETEDTIGTYMSYGIFSEESDKRMNTVAVELFDKLITKALFSCTEDDGNNPFKPEAQNVFHKLNIKGGLDKILRELNELFMENERNKKNSLTIFSNSLFNLENALIPVFIGMAKDELDSNPNNKVIIALNRKDNINEIYDLLSEDYKRIIKITGEQVNEREELVKKFQREDSRYRIIVAISNSIKQSISLDDRTEGGKYQRTLIISPSCFFINMLQLEKRVFRMTTTSKPKIYYVYGLPNDTEDIEKTDIIDKNVCNSIHFKVILNMIKKEKILKIFHKEDSLKFPSELQFHFYKEAIYPRK